jgi:hypothetical protein
MAAAGVVAAEVLADAADGWLQPDANATDRTMTEPTQDSITRDFMLLLL